MKAKNIEWVKKKIKKMKRFSIFPHHDSYNDGECTYDIEEDEKGGYVDYEDIEKLLKLLEKKK